MGRTTLTAEARSLVGGEAAADLESVEMRGLFSFAELAVGTVGGSLAVQICATLPDRDSGEPTRFVSTLLLEPWELGSDPAGKLGVALRAKLLALLAHEFDECFLAAGIRLRDPHAA